MNVPARIDPLPPLDLERSLKTLSLPEWLQRSVNGLTVGWEDVIRQDGVPARRNIPVIVKSLAPSPEACWAIDRRLVELRAAREAIDIDVAMAKVTELLLSFAGQAMNEAGAKARARGYITALEDLPAWAIAEACRCWLRGEAGEDQNYNFAPSPPILRKIAEKATSRVDNQIAVLERLLSAQVIDDPIEFSEEHSAAMRMKLAEFWRGLGKPVPKMELPPPEASKTEGTEAA